MPAFTEPITSYEPVLAVAGLQKASGDTPLNAFPGQNASHRPSHQPSEITHAGGDYHEQQPHSKPKPKPTTRSTRSKRHSSNDTHGFPEGAKRHVVNQTKKNKTTQRGRHRSRKESSKPPLPPSPKTGSTRPPLPPDYVLTRQGNALHRELNRVLKNGRMMSWQQNIFAGAFRKIHEALQELGSRDEKGAPITETEHHARAYARKAFDRFKMCMEKV